MTFGERRIHRSFMDPTASEAIWRLDRTPELPSANPNEKKKTPSPFSPKASPQLRTAELIRISNLLAELPGHALARRKLVMQYERLTDLQAQARGRGRGRGKRKEVFIYD